MTSVTQRPGRRKQVWKHSTWITASWEWFLEFVGRAAEAILVISVLYASVKLLPVVHMPAGLDVVVFVAQFVALDVGGLSLGKLAKRAAEAGNDAGALYAARMSKALISVMIAGVVVVAVEQLFKVPDSWKVGIDTVLLIARSILAVLYGHVIHSVKVEDQAESPASPNMQAHLSWSLVALAAWQEARVDTRMREMQATFEHRLAAIAGEQARMQASIQQVQNAPVVVPEIDTQGIIQAVAEYLIPQFQAKFQALDQAISRQNVAISEVVNQAKRLPEKAASTQAPQAPLRQKNQARDTEQNVIRLVPANASRDEMKAEAIRLHRVEGLSSYKIAEKLGKPAKTVQSWLSSGKDQAEGEDFEAAN